MGKNEASVFPVAVGEINKTFLPSRILGIVFSCGSVGFENPFCSISLRTGFTSKSKAFLEGSKTGLNPDIERSDVKARVKALWKYR